MVCAMNRISVYILLSVLVNLCGLMFLIASKMYNKHASANVVKTLGVSVPILLAFVGYALEADENDISKNTQLNVTKHAFSCSMRFDRTASATRDFTCWLTVKNVLGFLI
jgi:hypothetical protein